MSIKDKIKKNASSPNFSKEEKQKVKELQKEERKQLKKKQSLIDKETKQREKLEKQNQNMTPTWEYKYDADLTIGEKKLSNKAKIALIIILLILLTASIVGYIYRYHILDYFTEPQIMLSTNEVDIEVGSEFDYKDYLIENNYPDRYEITYPDNKDVDTNKLGTYELKFKLKNLMKEVDNILIINVKDTTSPTIELKESVLTFTRDVETKDFNPEEHIKEIKDNYDDKKDIKLTYTKTYDWSKDKVEVIYTVEDKSGNVSSNTLTIIVNDPPKEPEKEVEIVYVEVPSQSGNNSGSNGNTSSGNSGNNGSSGNSGSSSGNSSNSSSGSSSGNSGNSGSSGGNQQSHFLNVPGNFTVKVGDLQTFTQKIQEGVSSDEYVTIDYSKVNLTIPGPYTVTYTTPSQTKSITVTVIE